MREPFEIIVALGLPKPAGILQVGANTGQEIGYFKDRKSNGLSGSMADAGCSRQLPISGRHVSRLT